MKNAVLSALLLFAFSCFGSNTDSLRKALNNARQDTGKIAISEKLASALADKNLEEAYRLALTYYQQSEKSGVNKYKIIGFRSLAEILFRMDSTSRSLELNKKALRLAEVENDVNAVMEQQLRIAKNYAEMGNLKEASSYAQKIVSKKALVKNRVFLARAYNALGAANYNMGNQGVALNHLYEAMYIYEDLGRKADVATACKNLAIIYDNMKSYGDAAKILRKGLSLYIALKDTSGIADCYGTLGSIKNTMHQGDSAEYFIKKELQLLETKPDKSQKAMALGNLAITYKQNGDFKKAEIEFIKVMHLFEEMKSERLVMISHINLGDLYTQMHQHQKAVNEFQTAMAYGRKTGGKDLVSAAYNGLYIAYKSVNDFRNSLEYYKKYIEVRDSMYLQTNENKIADIENRFKLEKIETENELLKSKNALTELELATADAKAKSTRYKIYALSIGFLLMVTLALLSLRAYRIKRRNNKLLEEKNNIITRQKNQVQTQKLVLETKNKEILDSINYAKRLQEAILPPLPYFTKNLPESFVLYQPKDIVAGDFYWMEVVDGSGLVLFAAADCTGHGVPGALVSVVCSNALNRTLKEFNITEPGRVLDKVRELVVETFEKSENEVKDGMDISLCAYDPRSGKLSWAGANNPLWIIRNKENELVEIKADKQPIGKMESMKPFTTHSFELKKGDTAYVFTDGYVDQFGGPGGKKFKSSQLKSILLGMQQLSMQEQKLRLEKCIVEWKGSLEQIDDICVIGFRA